MKEYIYLLTLILLTAGCYTPTKTIFSNSNVIYEQTPSHLIKQSIKALDAVNKLSENISKKDKIIIASIENYQTVDSALIVGIEDEIIKEFVLSGYTILERDLHALAWMNNELNYQNNKTLKSKVIDSLNFLPRKSELSSSDKIISYRVIECGIIYKEDPEDASIYNREARTILEIRVINSTTSEVIDAVTLDGISKDEIPKKNISEINKFNYKYYKPLLPNSYSSDESAVILKNQEIEKKAESPEKNKKAITKDLIKISLVIVGWMIGVNII